MIRTYSGTFRRLVAWKQAKDLTKEVYRLIAKFPLEEKFGLSIQMKRAAVSVMSNIAEGNQRKGNAEKLHFFNIAISSLTELDNQGELAYELGYFPDSGYERFIELINKTGYLISKLSKSINNPNNPKNHDNHNNHKQGFSLVELTVVVAVVAILSVSTIVGFDYFGQEVKAKEAAGMIEDAIRQAEMSVLKGDFLQVNAHLTQDYVILEEIAEGDDETLLDLGTGSCYEGTPGHRLSSGSGSAVKLYKRNDGGQLLEVKTIGGEGSAVCGNSPPGMDARAWEYQVADGGRTSPIFRFIQFNLDTDYILITGEPAYRLEIKAPYAKKSLYADDELVSVPVELPLRHRRDRNSGDPSADLETLTLNP